jgi:hypothetical protein
MISILRNTTMFQVSDGIRTGFSPIFPLIRFPFKNMRPLNGKRMLWAAQILVPIEVLICLWYIFLLGTYAEPTGVNAFSAILPSAAILFKFIFVGGRVVIKTNRVAVIGIAPKIVFLEHFLLFSAYALAALWVARIMVFDLLEPNFFTILAGICFIYALVPSLNFVVYRLNPLNKIF